MNDTTPWGDPITEREGAGMGVSRSPIQRERTTRLWTQVLQDLRRAGVNSAAVHYLDLDYGHDHGPLPTGHALLMACKEAFMGTHALPALALGGLDTLPPRRPPPAPSMDGAPPEVLERLRQGRSAEGLGPDGTDRDHWRAELEH